MSCEEEQNMHNELDKKVLRVLDAHGGSHPNMEIIRELRINGPTYYESRERLIDLGLIAQGVTTEPGTGIQGGVVYITDIERAKIFISGEGDAPRPDEEPGPITEEEKSEASLYPGIESCLKNYWIKDQRYEEDLCFVQCSAKGGSRRTGGIWTRPDLIVVGGKRFKLLGKKVLDVITFEVKREGGFDPRAVYEALSQSRSATRSYLLICCSAGYRQDPDLQRILHDAEMFGIGVIVADLEHADQYESWQTLIEAKRKEPSPDLLNQLLMSQFSDEQRKKIESFFEIKVEADIRVSQ